MIKLFSLKQKKDGEQNKGTQKKSSAAQLRIQKGNEIHFRECRTKIKQKRRTSSSFFFTL